MSERKILLFVLSVIFYCLYNVHMWFMTNNANEEKPPNPETIVESQPDAKPNNTRVVKVVVKAKVVPFFVKDACSALEVFIQKSKNYKTKAIRPKNMDQEHNAITAIGITVFLGILVLNAFLDVLKVKEKERVRREMNPNGERRQSLAEFANKKMLRRESSKFGLQLFQIAESVTNPDEEEESRKESRPYTRGDSTNSYLSEKTNKTESSGPPSVGETPSTEARLTKRQSATKLFGARPAPMVRRSSYPALPLNPEIQALMLGGKQASFDSDNEGDGKGRRVRIIRRF